MTMGWTIIMLGCMTAVLCLPHHHPLHKKQSAVADNDFIGKGTNEIATALLQSNVDKNDNMVYSPFGYSAILAVFSEGAKGPSRDEIASALHFPKDVQKVREAYREILERFVEKKNTNSPEFKNWFYIYKNYTVNQELQDVLRQYYLTEVKYVDRPEEYISHRDTVTEPTPEPESGKQEKVSIEFIEPLVDHSVVKDIQSEPVQHLEKEKSHNSERELLHPAVIADVLQASYSDKENKEKSENVKIRNTSEKQNESNTSENSEKEVKKEEKNQENNVSGVTHIDNEHKEKEEETKPKNLHDKTINQVKIIEKTKEIIAESSGNNKEQKEMTPESLRSDVNDNMKIPEDNHNKMMLNSVTHKKSEHTPSNNENVEAVDQMQKTNNKVKITENEFTALASNTDKKEVEKETSNSVMKKEVIKDVRDKMDDKSTTAHAMPSTMAPIKTNVQMGSFPVEHYSGMTDSSLKIKGKETKPQMIIFNGLYYKGDWEIPFEKKPADQSRPFYVSEKDKVLVPSIHSQGMYHSGDISHLDSKAIVLPYKGGRYSLLILVPNSRDGLQKLISNLSGYPLKEIYKQLTEKTVDVCLPCFEINTISKPISSLQKLGVNNVTSIFNPETADLSGISSTEKGLYVEELVQMVTFKVDADYSKANFLTASIASSRSNVQKFQVNQPFLFYLRDDVDDLTIVNGKIVDPTPKSYLHFS